MCGGGERAKSDDTHVKRNIEFSTQSIPSFLQQYRAHLYMYMRVCVWVCVISFVHVVTSNLHGERQAHSGEGEFRDDNDGGDDEDDEDDDVVDDDEPS